MKNIHLKTFTSRPTARRELGGRRRFELSALSAVAGFLLIAGASACGSSSNNKDAGADSAKGGGSAGQGGAGGEELGGAGGDGVGGGAGGLGGDSVGGGAGTNVAGAGGSAGGSGGGAGTGQGGLGGSVEGTGGAPATITCATKVMATQLTDFEYLDTAATLAFTTTDGFLGKFFGDNGDYTAAGSMSFVVATGADAHSATHALTVSGQATGFVEIGLDFNTDAGCLDLSAFKGITFWAKGSGKLGLKVTDGRGDYDGFPMLSATYAQYTLMWSQLDGFAPPVINKKGNFLFYVTGPMTAPTSLFLDDISFVP